MTRRALLAALAATACGRKRAARYQGWLFVASRGERGIAVADLAQFQRATSIPLPHSPDDLFLARQRVFATSREGSELFEIDPGQFRVSGRIPLPGKPLATRVLPGGGLAMLLTDEPPAVMLVDLETRRVSARLPLEAAPGDADLAEGVAVLTIPGRNSIVRILLPNLKIAGETEVGGACGTVRFRKDGRTILAGVPAVREIVTLDAGTGRLLTRLPLPISPLRFCFNADGGQMFVTGTGEDSLAIVYPYKNEVDQTILGGTHTGRDGCFGKNKSSVRGKSGERRSDDPGYRLEAP